jgi:glycosyltransferase involved in cell wall biosynthesis
MADIPNELPVDLAKPLLSICIATYNRAALLAQTLQHVRDTFVGNDVEVVVSDNCSPDETQEVIARFAPLFAHFRSIRQSENRGMMPNVAAAIALATGEYTYSLNDDDEVFLEGIAAAVAIMRSEQGVVAVYGGHREWVRASGFLGPPEKLVERREDFAQGDKIRLFNRFSLLWYPISRTQILQRYFTYDDRSFGFWELAGALIERGALAVIPDLLYKHAQTEPRMEYELTKAWYHDQHRAQYECFLGRVGLGNYQELSVAINQRTVAVYTQGARFANLKKEYLTARQFVLRSRPYGAYTEAQITSWEKQCLVYMVAERLLNHVRLATQIRIVLFEDAPKMRALREYFASIAPEFSVGSLSPQAWQASGLAPECFLVTYDFGASGWEQTTELGPTRCRAVTDIIESCRITNQTLGFEEQALAQAS